MLRRVIYRKHMPVPVALIIAGSFLIAHAAFAQSDGDERCGKKGTAMMFDNLAKSWVQTGAHCTPTGPGAPVDGEKRCGFAGYILKYEAKRSVWRSSQEHCNGAQSYIGWHQID